MAVADFADARVEDYNYDHPPSAPRLVQRIRSYVPRQSGEQLRIAYDNEVSDEERARMSDKLLGLAAELGARHLEEKEEARRQYAARLQQANDRLHSQDTRPIEERLKIQIGT